MFEIEQHVADIRLRVSAGTLEELFRDAVRGLFAVLAPGAADDVRELRRRIALDSVDRTCVLVDFLGEVLAAAHIERAEFNSVQIESLTETAITAVVTGNAPVSFGRDVKAVTYHEAEVRFGDGMWSTMLVLDI